MEDKNCIIDPLTCICKLSLLSFFMPGTRLRLSNYVLTIQEYNLMQCVERYAGGDTRKDISHLVLPIIKVIKWYILDKTYDDEFNKAIKNIAMYAIKGLQTLQKKTYDDDLGIKIIIQYLINLLNDSLKETWNEEYVINIEQENILSEKIKNNFDISFIISISNMLLESEKIKEVPENVNVIIRCAHDLLKNRDQQFLKLIKNINTNL
jgi:hypothetical protein